MSCEIQPARQSQLTSNKLTSSVDAIAISKIWNFDPLHWLTDRENKLKSSVHTIANSESETMTHSLTDSRPRQALDMACEHVLNCWNFRQLRIWIHVFLFHNLLNWLPASLHSKQYNHEGWITRSTLQQKNLVEPLFEHLQCIRSGCRNNQQSTIMLCHALSRTRTCMHKPTSNVTHAKSENCCGKDFLIFLISSKKI